MPRLVKSKRYRDVALHALRAGWIASHLFIPAIYRLEYRHKFFLPIFEGQVQGHYQIYSKIGQDWNTRATRLRANYVVFRDISVVFLGITAPYMGTTKAATSPMTFALGSLCILYSLVGSLIAHVYIANGENLRKPVVTDYWLKASHDSYVGSGLWLWTIISLPAVWLIPSIISFVAFIVSAAWDVPQATFDHLSVYKVLLLSTIAWAIIHAVMITMTWLRIKDRSCLAL